MQMVWIPALSAARSIAALPALPTPRLGVSVPLKDEGNHRADLAVAGRHGEAPSEGLSRWLLPCFLKSGKAPHLRAFALATCSAAFLQKT